jgi:glycosyltransferase involved in cell wall biosynthesis
MQEKAKLSVCLIVKDEPLLEQCLQSFRDYVDEIVIVDTGSKDNTPEIAKKYCDIFEVYTECNDSQGKIENFSKARQRSFDLATNKTVMWIDSDDILIGAENLPKILADAKQYQKEGKEVCFLFPYEYSYSDTGEVTCKHYRERLITDKNKFHWVNWVHEVLIAKEGVDSILLNRDDCTFKHKRQYGKKPGDPSRNLRILKRFVEVNGDSDARQLYYLGLEYSNNGFSNEAIQSLEKYISLSGWLDEKVMACLKLVEIHQSLGNYEEGLRWGFKAIESRHDWCEGYLAVARMFYFIALKGGPQEMDNWKKCVHFAKQGLSLPPTQTVLFINPFDRESEIHKYLNMALNKLGDVRGALESVKTGLKKEPSNHFFINNKKIYENFIACSEIIQNLNILNDNGKIESSDLDYITSIINGQNKTQQNQFKSLNKSNHKLDIVFFAGNGLEIWTPESIRKNGIGGSELMMHEMSKRLAKLGHKVRIYNSCGTFDGWIFDDVQYLSSEKYHDINCDVCIVSRRADALDDCYNINSKLKLLWIHDTAAMGATNERLLKADRILTLSNWHRDLFIQNYCVHPDQVIKTRNGIDLNRFDKKIQKNQFKCINSSSPDRSWPILLDVWPKIKERVPQAELHLFYGFNNWDISSQNDPGQIELIAHLKQKIKDMKPLGVVYHGRVDQEQLAQEFMSSGVWVYPTFFSETSCLSAMEAQAGGCRMVTSSIAALNETAGDRAALIDGDWTSPEYQKSFINACIGALQNPDNSDRLQFKEYAKNNFGLDELANEWNTMFFDLIEAKKVNPITPYQPTTAYTKK